MVHPSSIERRKMERRTHVENAVHLIEQRVLGDRRSNIGTRGAVATEYSTGWLCFASEGERRRLVPIPVNWMSANDGQVSEWCRIAKRVLKCGPTWDPADEREESLPRSKDVSSGRPPSPELRAKGRPEDAPDEKKG